MRESGQDSRRGMDKLAYPLTRPPPRRRRCRPLPVDTRRRRRGGGGDKRPSLFYEEERLLSFFLPLAPPSLPPSLPPCSSPHKVVPKRNATVVRKCHRPLHGKSLREFKRAILNLNLPTRQFLTENKKKEREKEGRAVDPMKRL